MGPGFLWKKGGRMIASIYTLDRSDISNLRIKDAYSLHKAVYNLFPKRNGRMRDFLYADKGGDFKNRRILILSKRSPEIPEFGKIESKRVPESFLNHEYYGFRICINPVKKEKKTGKLIPVRGDKDLGITDSKALKDWFIKKAPGFGFEIPNTRKWNEPSFEVTGIGFQAFKLKGKTVTHGKAVFHGKLKIINHDLFIKSFEEGIGKAKGFGFGLLELIPLKNE